MICDAPQRLILLMWLTESYSKTSRSSLPDQHLETPLISNHLSLEIHNCPPQAGSLALYAAMHCIEIKISQQRENQDRGHTSDFLHVHFQSTKLCLISQSFLLFLLLRSANYLIKSGPFTWHSYICSVVYWACGLRDGCTSCTQVPT